MLTSLARQALAHGGVALLLVYTVALADSWEKTGGAGVVALYLAAAWAFLAGLGLSHILHEWCHFFGAVLARSAVTLKPAVHPLFFDYDFPAHTPRQFLCLSVGGLLGNVLLLCLLLLCVAPTTLVLTSLLAAVAGQLVFVLMLELPVSLGVLAGKAPLASLTDHFGQGGPLFLRAAIGGAATAALVFLVRPGTLLAALF